MLLWPATAVAQEAPVEPEASAEAPVVPPPTAFLDAAKERFEAQDLPNALSVLRQGLDAWPEELELWTTASGFLLASGDVEGLGFLLDEADRHGLSAELAPHRVTAAVLARAMGASPDSPLWKVDIDGELAAYAQRGEPESLLADSLSLVDVVVRFEMTEGTEQPGAGELVRRADRLLTHQPPTIDALRAGAAALTLVDDFALARQRLEEAVAAGVDAERLLAQIQLVEAADTGRRADSKAALRTYAHLADDSPTARAEALIAELSCKGPPKGAKAEQVVERLRALRPELDETWQGAIDTTLATLAASPDRWLLDASGSADANVSFGPLGPQLQVTMAPVAALLPVVKE